MSARGAAGKKSYPCDFRRLLCFGGTKAPRARQKTFFVIVCHAFRRGSHLPNYLVRSRQHIWRNRRAICSAVFRLITSSTWWVAPPAGRQAWRP